MANKAYRKFSLALMRAEIDLEADDFRALLVMGNTTADTEEPEFLAGFTVLDELDATGYARIALTGELVSEDPPANRTEWIADGFDFGSPDADASRDVAAVVVYKHVTDDSDSPVLLYIDSVAAGPTFPFTVNGSAILLTPNTEGLLQLRLS